MSSLTIWLTGLPGAGKTTIGIALRRELPYAFLLDGDDFRAGLNSDLDFSQKSRTENTRRLGEVALYIARSGYIAIVASISPFADDRERVRLRHNEYAVPFVEAFVSTPLTVCESRDPKRLYERARNGNADHVTGITDPYEPPQQPEIVLATHEHDLDSLVAQLVLLASKHASCL